MKATKVAGMGVARCDKCHKRCRRVLVVVADAAGRRIGRYGPTCARKLGYAVARAESVRRRPAMAAPRVAALTSTDPDPPPAPHGALALFDL